MQPKYQKRTARGKDYARVYIDGKYISLGVYNSPESLAKYESLLAEWKSGNLESQSFNVDELIADYLDHADGYYRKAGEPTSEIYAVRAACQRLHDLYGGLPASKFGPRQFKTVRDGMVRDGLSLKTCNHYCLHILKAFKFAASDSRIKPEVYLALQTVEPLKPGRCQAKVPRTKPPAMVEHMEAIATFVSRRVGLMMQIQYLTGMRPGEICGMRRDEIDMSREVWVYTPSRHKTEHHGKSRQILINSNAQRILLPSMSREVVFPMLVASYRRAIARGCQQAGIPRFSPQQIRKAFAVKIRNAVDLEAAQVLLGHSSARTTEQFYAGSNIEAGMKIIEEIWS